MIRNAAKTFYDNSGLFGSSYDMLPDKVNKLNTTQADIYYAFANVGSTTPVGYDWRRFTFRLESGVLKVFVMGGPRSGITAVRTIKYNETVAIKNTDPRYNDWLSSCGNTGGCGASITMRSDASLPADEKSVRGWRILGGSSGTDVKFGDTIKLQNLWNMLFASPCGSTGCGVDITLRPAGADGDLYKWKILGGPIGQSVTSLENVQFESLPSSYAGHGGRKMDLCGSTASCGVNVSFRAAPTFYNWTIQPYPVTTKSEHMHGLINYQTPYHSSMNMANLERFVNY